MTSKTRTAANAPGAASGAQLAVQREGSRRMERFQPDAQARDSRRFDRRERVVERDNTRCIGGVMRASARRANHRRVVCRRARDVTKSSAARGRNHFPKAGGVACMFGAGIDVL
jgi:hypothetical protein